MRAHLYIAFGLLIAAIFVFRAIEALNAPGLGLSELYVLGGFLIAALIIRMGLKMRKADRE